MLYNVGAMIEVSYSEARARLAELLDRVSDDREVVRISRQGNRPGAVIIDADEYASLEETAYLLSSPANARHILRALVELEAGQGRAFESVGDLWRELDSEGEDARKAGTTAHVNEHPRDTQVEKRGQVRVDAPPISGSASNPRSRGGTRSKKA
jgi:antitoxin YefM